MKTLLELNLLIAVGFPLWTLLSRALRPSQSLKMTHALIMAALAIPVALLFVHQNPLTRPSVQIWSAPSIHTHAAGDHSPAMISLANHTLLNSASLVSYQIIFGLMFLLGAVLIGFRLIRSYLALKGLLSRSILARKIGHVEILINTESAVPFSYWLPGHAYVVIPESFVCASESYRIAILHEIQHHRQGDTRFAHVLQALKLGLFWNPLFHLWEQAIASLQEFACDEALVDLKQVSPHAYGSCLLKAAEQCLNSHALMPVGTTGMALGTSGLILKRRIDMMFDPKRKQVRSWIVAVGGTLAVAVLGTVAFASQSLVRDRRVSMDEAKSLAALSSPGNPFPIVVNADVVEQLNRFVGTPDGREFIRGSVARMQNYRSQIEAKIQSYSLPDELMAVPLIESGYENAKEKHAAGLWMFIAQTAKHYGLRVDDQQDDRLNVDAETDAAMRYLGANFLRFQDWQLALMAYNEGESHVQSAIDATGSRDAWKLIQAGYENDKGYLAKTMAAVLILKNPSLYN